MTKIQQLSTNNQQPNLKVCGLTDLNQIDELINLNIDFLGFIFYEKSPRYVLNHLTLEQISDINYQKKVGVFVNETIENIIAISEKANLNLIQLHGDEDFNFIENLKHKLDSNIQIIKVIRIGEDFKVISDKLNTKNQQPNPINYLLFDTDSKAFGGTGKTFDWKILNQLNIEIPYFLSGGISLENVEEVKNIKQKPFALDINSKFEIEAGFKDLDKIKKLLIMVNDQW